MQGDIQEAYEEHARKLAERSVPLYPTWSGRTHRTADIQSVVEELIRDKSTVTIAGRVHARRAHGGSTFLDVYDSSGRIQVLMRRDSVGGDQYELLALVDRGDIIAVSGSVVRTKAGEITVDAQSWTMLAKARSPLPDRWYGLKDIEKRARRRELDMILNAQSRAMLQTRSIVTGTIRDFLRERGFLEVETPVLQPIPGGTSARPFITHHNALDVDLYLRISPELYLKRLVVGGEDRVFEIARCFRNEGVDRSHNPEFTMCEFYMAYATMEDLIVLTEELFVALLAASGKSNSVSYQGKDLPMAPPWKQVSFVEEMRAQTDIDVLEEQDPRAYLAWMDRHDIALPASKTLPSLLDTIYKEMIRKKIWDTTIVRDFPVIMEPLAKRVDDDPRMVQRFQLVAAGEELIKAYTELNDPEDQEKRFREQEAMRDAGDDEAHRLDKAFLEALRIGLPPTAGWGMGIDRIAMLLTDTSHIRDVIPFPLMRPRDD